MMPLAIFRADASLMIGAGHVARCLALADALSEAGWSCAMVVGPESTATFPALAGSRHALHVIDGPVELQPERLGAMLGEVADLLVFDHYGIDAAYESACRNFARRIMVIDDLADRKHDCDILLDQGPSRHEADYSSLAPADALMLTGADYALLRPAFAAFRDAAAPRELSSRSDIFVSFGATDPDNVTESALEALAATRSPGYIQVVLSSAAPNRPAIERQIAQSNSPAHLNVDHTDTVPLLAASRLALGAGGVGALERSCCGVPSLIAVIAENQREVAAAVEAAGAAEIVESVDPSHLATRIAALLGSPERLDSMSMAGLVLCDGRGARRVVMAIAPERTRTAASVRLRPARLDDEAIILDWQRAPGARRFARNPAVPSAAEHRAWIRATLADPDRILSIVDCDGEAAGVLRLDRRAPRDGLAAFEVSIVVAPDHQRQGIGRAALALARRLVPQALLLATIHPDNNPSPRIFRDAGYLPDGDQFACWPKVGPKCSERPVIEGADA